METTAATSPTESFAATNVVTQNGGNGYHHPSSPTLNNFGSSAVTKTSSSHFGTTGGVDDEDEYGPETDVDTVDDSHIGSSVVKNNVFETNNGKPNNFDKLDQLSENGVVKAPLYDKIDESNNVGGSLSEESDEEGWKYVKEAKENKESDSSNCLHAGEDIDDMAFPLNPNAVPFIPTSPVSSRSKEGSITEESPLSPAEYLSEARDRLLNDQIIASSPSNGFGKSLDNVDVPSLDEFKNEICKRPSDITKDYLDNNLNVNNVSFSSVDQENSNETLLGVSTKAVYSDESGYADNLADIMKDLREKEEDVKSDDVNNGTATIAKDDAWEKMATITPASSTTMSLSTEDVQNAFDKELSAIAGDDKQHFYNNDYSFNDSNVTFERDSLNSSAACVMPELNSVLNTTTTSPSYNETGAAPDDNKSHKENNFSFENYHSTVGDTNNSAYLTSFKEHISSHSLDFTDVDNPTIKSNAEFDNKIDDDYHHHGFNNPFSMITDKQIGIDNNHDNIYEDYRDKNVKNEKNLEIGRKSAESDSFLGETIGNSNQRYNDEDNEVVDTRKDDFEQRYGNDTANSTVTSDTMSSILENDFYPLNQTEGDFRDFQEDNDNYSKHADDFQINDNAVGRHCSDVDIIVAENEPNEEEKHEEKVDEVAENVNKIVQETTSDGSVDLTCSTQNRDKQFDDDVSSSDICASYNTNPVDIVHRDNYDNDDGCVPKVESVGSLEQEASLETMIYKEELTVENAPPSAVVQMPADKVDDKESVPKEEHVIKTCDRQKLADTVDEPLMSSFDAETPYKHDCSRMMKAENSIPKQHFNDLTPTFHEGGDHSFTSIKPDLTCELKTTPDLLSKINANIIIDTECCTGADPYQSMLYNEMPESDFKPDDVYIDKDKPESDLEMIKESIEPLAHDNSIASEQDSTYPLSSEETNRDIALDAAADNDSEELQWQRDNDKELQWQRDNDKELQWQNDNKANEDSVVASEKVIVYDNSVAMDSETEVSEPFTNHEEKTDMSKDELLGLHAEHSQLNAAGNQQEEGENGCCNKKICSTPPPTPIPATEEEEYSMKIVDATAENEQSAAATMATASSKSISDAVADKVLTATVLAAGVATAVAVGTTLNKTEVRKEQTPAANKSPATSTTTTAKKMVDAAKKSGAKPSSTVANKTLVSAKPKSPGTTASSASSTVMKKSVPSLSSNKPTTKLSASFSSATPRVTATATKLINKTTTITGAPAKPSSTTTTSRPKTSVGGATNITAAALNKSSTKSPTTTAPKLRPATAPLKSSPKQLVTNGDISKTINKVATSLSNKPSATTTNKPINTLKSTITSSAAAKTSVNLSTRTSLAPKTKLSSATLTKTSTNATSSSTITATKSSDKKPLLHRVSVKEEQKSLPIKRTSLTTTRPLSSTTRTSKTDTKTPPVKKMAGSATAVAIRKPAPAPMINQTVDDAAADPADDEANEVAHKQNGEVTSSVFDSKE